MQSISPTPAERDIQNTRSTRLSLILGCSSLMLFLIVIGSLVTMMTDSYYRMFGYAIVITGIFLMMVIIRNPNPPNVQRSREGSIASLQVIENLPYSGGPPTYSELLAEDLLNSQRNASGVVESTATHMYSPKNEPVAPPPSYDIAIGESRDHIHSVCEVVPQIGHDDSIRTSDHSQSSVFPTGSRVVDEGLPSYTDAVTWIADQEEQSTHDRQYLIT